MAKEYLRKKKDKMAIRLGQLDEDTNKVIDEVSNGKTLEEAETSVFANLPKNKDYGVTQVTTSEVISSTDKTVLETSTNVARVEPLENPVSFPAPTKVYSVMGGDDDDEYYTFYAPCLTSEPADPSAFYFVAFDAFKKGIIAQQVLGAEVEVYYKTNSVPGELKFPLSQGVLVKEHFISELNWIEKNTEQAAGEIKDLIIAKYNEIVPSLINKMNVMDAQLKQVKQSAQRKQSNEDLISL